MSVAETISRTNEGHGQSDQRSLGTNQATPSDRWVVLLLSGLAFCLRLGAIVVITGINATPEPGSDDSEYDTYAWNVAQGRGYRGQSPDVTDQDHLTAYRPPTAPLYYAAIYSVFGHRYAAAHIMNSLLSAVTVLLLYRVTLVCFGRRAAILAAVAFTFYPVSISQNLGIMSETLAGFLLCLFVYCCLFVKERRGGFWMVGAGFLFGLVLLCKPGFALLLPLLLVWAWVVCRTDRRLWLHASALPVMAGLVLLPWIIRNHLVMGSFIPFSTQGGSVLLQANNRVVVEDPTLYGYCVWDTYLPEYGAALRQLNDEIKRDTLAKELGIQWLRANPDKWFYLMQGRLVRQWIPAYYGSDKRLIGLASAGYWTIILGLFAAAVVPVTARFLDEGHPGIMMQLLIAATIGMGLATIGVQRYRFPVDPFCIAIAAAGASWIVERGFYQAILVALRTLCALVDRHKLATGLGVAALVCLALYWKADQNYIERHRDGECKKKLHAIQQAVIRYSAARGQPPASLGELVPAFLPNLDSLHCPKHSLDWTDYQLLASQDARAGANLISYEIVLPGSDGQPWLVAESSARHSGTKNTIESGAPAADATRHSRP